MSWTLFVLILGAPAYLWLVAYFVSTGWHFGKERTLERYFTKQLYKETTDGQRP